MIELHHIYLLSEDVVARDIEGEMIIVPVASGIGDMEDELYTLNDIGRAIWQRLDGKTALKDLINALGDEYDAPPGQIETDVVGFMSELLRRGLILRVD